MKTRKQSGAAEAPPEFNGLVDQSQNNSQDNSVPNTSADARPTLLDASRQHVNKLLHRANARGAAVRKRKGIQETDLNPSSSRIGKQKTTFEGEDGLFYQRRSLNKLPLAAQVNLSADPLICGAPASIALEFVQGRQSERNNFSLSSERNSEEDIVIENSHRSDGEQIQASKFEQNCYQSHRMEDEPEIIKESWSQEEDFGWEVGVGTPVNDPDAQGSPEKGWTGELTIELEDDAVGTGGKQSGNRRGRRATARDKEFAELVHKAHLLCLLARGRLVDTACDDPLLQASLLSVVPSHIKFGDSEKLTASMLQPLVKWFQNNFQVHSDGENVVPANAGEDLPEHFRCVLSRQAGTAEEVAALSVALLRALGFTTRYVKVLDVASLKPDMHSLVAPADWDLSTDVEEASQMFLQNKTSVGLGHVLARCAPQYMSPDASLNSSQTSQGSNFDKSGGGSPDFSVRGGKTARSRGRSYKLEGPCGFRKPAVPSLNISAECNSQIRARGRGKRKLTANLGDASGNASGPDVLPDVSMIHETELRSKRKGDQEFELQLAMAMEATAASAEQKHKENNGVGDDKPVSPLKSTACTVTLPVEKEQKHDNEIFVPGTKRLRHVGAVWSRKMGPLLHWGEVFCGGEGVDGKWVHVDAGKGILDGAGVVEGAATASKFPLRYVVAFAGNGAKDVTSRYVTMWSSISPLRVDSSWWNATLYPLKELEVAATSGSPSSITFQKSQKSVSKIVHSAEQEQATTFNQISSLIEAPVNAASSKSSIPALHSGDRASLEDMELEVRTYTEPLPTNQQAYKNHHLYGLEKWLTKYQILHPRGPVLGYCGGQEVFPRTCVQNLHTPERWLREGLKVRGGEKPAKVIRTSHLANKEITPEVSGSGDTESSEFQTTALFGKWQTEPWQPPPAVDGIVPKNQRGHVDVWSEKCLPPGTVHLRLPRLLRIAKELGIDFAPAMVGFETRNRRSVPVFEGIVVCKEFEDVLLAVYAEEEERRMIELDKKREDQAVTRWQQLMRSISTRLRLQATYEVSDLSNVKQPISAEIQNSEKATEVSTLGGYMLGENLGVNTGTNLKGTLNNEQKLLSELPHEHTFPEENQSYDPETGMWTKTCPCGFTLQIEEM